MTDKKIEMNISNMISRYCSNILYLFLFCLTCFVISLIFLRNIYWATVFAPVGILMDIATRRERKKLVERRQLIDFRQMIEFMSGSMKSVGKAPEICFDEAVENMKKMHMDKVDVYKNALIMQNNLHSSYQASFPSELETMAQKLSNPEIHNFATAVKMCYGINNQGINDVIKSTSSLIMEKNQIEDEIVAAIKPQLGEFLIMYFTPAGMLLMMNYMMPGFFDNLYKSNTGFLVEF